MFPDNYKLKEILHATVNSRVCLVERDGQDFVAKLPPLDNEYTEKRFSREISALERAEGFHTMPILDSDDTLSWYIMPKAVGDLASFPVPSTVESVLAVLEAIGLSLHPLHLVGEVHRDLKPGNLLWLDDIDGARWVVADFGIVRNPAGLTTSGLTRAGRLLGTEGWAAPEQRTNAHDATPAADVYAAGLIAAWMLTGLHPSEGAVEHLTEVPISSAISRAVSERPQRRHSSLADFIAAARSELHQTRLSLAALIARGEFSEISAIGIDQPQVRDPHLDALAGMSAQDRDRWLAVDRDGLVGIIAKAIEGLVDNHERISFSSTIDPILTHGVELLYELALSNDPATRKFAVSVFGGISDIHQFGPARLALDRIDALSNDEQLPLRAAIHEAGAWEFFTNMASGRFASHRKTPLLIELAGH